MDSALVEKFVQLSKISAILPPHEILANLEVITKYKDDTVFNSAGVLFFAKKPCRFLIHTSIRCIVFKGNSKIDIIDDKIFDNDIICNIEQVIKFVQTYTRISYKIYDTRRKEIREIPEAVLREVIVNAAAHRNYFEQGCAINVEIFDDRIEIYNPAISKGLKRKDLGKKSKIVNPLIASLLNRAGYMEKAGTGITRVIKLMDQEDLPIPVFRMDSFFTVIFERIKPERHMLNEPTNTYLTDKYISTLLLNENQLQLIPRLKIKAAISISEYQNMFKLTYERAKKDLLHLEEEGLLLRDPDEEEVQRFYYLNVEWLR